MMRGQPTKGTHNMTTPLHLTHSDLEIVLIALAARVSRLEDAAQTSLNERSSLKSREDNAALYAHAESLRQRARETQIVYSAIRKQQAAVRAQGGV
jgi:hypothetical protein